MAMLRGMERALLENKQLSAGLIFCMAREFSFEQNSIIVEKAIKYHSRGVVGIDVAGPASPGFKYADYKPLFEKARAAGLGITVHSGEVREANDMWEVLEFVRPQRIGHGILAAYDEKLMEEIIKRDIVLEVCPMSNLMTKAVKDVDELKFILRTFLDRGVKFCINTDWPETLENGHLRKQIDWLERDGLMTAEEIAGCGQIAFEASFVPAPGGLNAYLK